MQIRLFSVIRGNRDIRLREIIHKFCKYRLHNTRKCSLLVTYTKLCSNPKQTKERIKRHIENVFWL